MKDCFEWNNLIEIFPDLICVAGLNGYFKYLNPEWEKTTGYSLEELFSRPLFEFIHPDDHESTHEEIRRQLHGETTQGFMNRYRCKNGSYVILEWKAAPVEGGKLYAIARDVTERKRAEEAIIQSEKELKAVLENLELIAISLNTSGHITFCNDYLLHLTGWQREEIMGKNWFATFIPSSMRYELEQSIFCKTIMTNTFPAHYQNEIVTKEGDRRLIHWNNTASTDTEGNVVGVTCIGEDITERQQAEENSLAGKKRYEKLFNDSPVPLWEEDFSELYGYFEELREKGISDLNAYFDKYPSEIRECSRKIKILDVNRAALKLHHARDKGELFGNINKIFTGRSFDLLRNEFVALFAGRSWFESAGEVQTLDGEPKQIFLRLTIDLGEKNSKRAILATADITEHKQMEELLRESEAKYRSMMESMADPVYICSEDRRVEYMNPAMIRRIGRNAAGERCFRAIHGLNDKCEWCISREVFSGRTIETEVISPRDNRHYRIQNMPIHNGNGSKSKMSIFRDITDYKNAVNEKETAQARLLQAQKLDALGTLAGGIAHDFNNILSAIIGYTELSFDEAEKGSRLEDNLKEVLQAGTRAKDLINQILAFSRQPDEGLQISRMDTIVKEVLRFIKSSIPATIRIEAAVESDSLTLCDPTQIHQILMNLCANAAYAMEKNGGMLEVGLKDIMIESSSGVTKTGLRPGNYMQLKVSDTGEGIPADILDLIFEPYFTTKPFGEGTGMGLAVVRGIVDNYGGRVTVDSKIGKGSVFTILLPISKQLAALHDNGPGSLSTGSESILFVDDEPSITKMAGQLLRRLGYRVTTQTSSVEALDLFRSKPHDFDLVFSDMTMPNITGDKLAGEMMKIRQDIPVVLCTGYSKNLTSEKAREMGIKAVIYKPIIKEELAIAIRKVLDDKKGTK